MNADKKTEGLSNIAAGYIPAVYIHIPFCRKKCNYCDFVSADYEDKTADYIDNYLKVLVKEISLSLPCTLYPVPCTIYIGGGTPSILSEKQLEFLLTNLFQRFRVCANTKSEITFEVNPESITKEKLKILKNFQVNRLSFGLQSFDDDLLKFLGRIHTEEDFLTALKSARETGFENINIDLIFGIPGQMLENWKTTLKRVLQLNPEHISVYNLTVEEGTNFYKNGVTVDDDLSADMYKFAIEYLKKKSYHHYEISNFSRASKPGFECQHNINYWHNGEYLGFGLGAVSHIGGKRIKNTENIRDYLNGKFRSDFEDLNCEQKMLENLMLGLRLLEGVNINAGIKQKFFYNIQNLKKNGLIKEENNNVKLTDKGVMYANQVFLEFL